MGPCLFISEAGCMMGNRLDHGAETAHSVAHLGTRPQASVNMWTPPSPDRHPHQQQPSRYGPKAAIQASALMTRGRLEVTSTQLVLFIFLIEAFIPADARQPCWEASAASTDGSPAETTCDAVSCSCSSVFQVGCRAQGCAGAYVTQPES